jgi:hypothetical protein
MSERLRLANRRLHETVATEMFDQRFKIGFGRDLVNIEEHSDHRIARLGPIAEVFINAQKPNSILDMMCSDAAILMSLALQFGCPPDVVRRALKRNPDGSPASPMGFAADLLEEDS